METTRGYIGAIWGTYRGSSGVIGLQGHPPRSLSKGFLKISCSQERLLLFPGAELLLKSTLKPHSIKSMLFFFLCGII